MAGINLIRNVLLPQRLLNATALGISAVQHCKILVACLGLILLAQNRRRHKQSLLLLRISLQKLYLLPHIPLGIALFGNATLVLADHRIGRIHNGLRRTVIALQAENPGIGIILLEVEDVLYSCSAKSIDALGIVSHNRDVLVILCQRSENHILQEVSILILIDENKLEPCLYLGKSFRLVSQKAVGVQQDIIKVHYSLLLALFLIHLVDEMDVRAAGTLI